MTGRTIFITGGAGFIGSHVAETFLGRGYEVVVIDDLSTGSERNIPASAEFEKVDIVDQDAVARVFSSFRPKVVCHLAAQSSVFSSDPSAMNTWQPIAASTTVPAGAHSVSVRLSVLKPVGQSSAEALFDDVLVTSP